MEVSLTADPAFPQRQFTQTIPATRSDTAGPFSLPVVRDVRKLLYSNPEVRQAKRIEKQVRTPSPLSCPVRFESVL